MYSFVTMERLQQILNRKEAGAESSDIAFSLNLGNVLWPEYCPALGIKLDYFRKGQGKQTDYSPSFDRLNPDEGYTPENTRVISNRANRIKNNATAAQLRAIADYIDRELGKESE